MTRKVVIHMLGDEHDGIEGIVCGMTSSPPTRIAGPMQAFVEITLGWNRDANHCGPFKINIGPLAEGEIRHFDLVLSPKVTFPIHPFARIFGNWVGLRPWKGEQRDPGAEVRWCESNEPRNVTGVSTPYPHGPNSLQGHDPGSRHTDHPPIA